MYKKNHKEEFLKWANSYDTFAQIQKKVAKELIKKIDNKPKKILDLGSGTGEIYKNISWQYDFFVGIDCSSSMCQLHPNSNKIKIICSDFESLQLQRKLDTYAPFDIVISSSSLQWAQDLKSMFNFCKNISKNVAFSIFTKGTFRTIYDITDRKSFLPDSNDIINMSKKLLDAKVQICTYKLYFEDNLSKFRYIKKSGIGGGMEMLTYTQAKNLLKYYPLKYLEFEVLFVWGTTLKNDIKDII